MERYSHLQTMPNSPLTPLTPLSENTKFEFNFGGDGSLDAYIDSVRHEHRVEKQQKKLLSQANTPYHQEACPLHPRRGVFEVHDGQKKPAYYQQQQQQQQSNPKALHINYKQITPTPNKPKIVVHDHEATPTNIRTPLKPRNHNIPQNVNSKTPLTKLHLSPQTIPQQQQQQKQQQQQQQQPRVFKQASPVARRPLCPHVAKLLAQRGLNMYASVFQREEIDMFALQLLKLQDLHQMGITNQQHIDALVNHVRNVVKYL